MVQQLGFRTVSCGFSSCFLQLVVFPKKAELRLHVKDSIQTYGHHARHGKSTNQQLQVDDVILSRSGLVYIYISIYLSIYLSIYIYFTFLRIQYMTRGPRPGAQSSDFRFDRKFATIWVVGPK